MDTVEIVKLARKYVEQGWTRGAQARDAEGKSVDPMSGAARKWCLYGSLDRAATDAGVHRNTFISEILESLKIVVGSEPATWNDRPERTQAEVMRALDNIAEITAVALATGRGLTSRLAQDAWAKLVFQG